MSNVAPWRVAVTRDEDLDGPLSRALRRAGLEPVLCPVVEEHPPRDAAALSAAAARLEQYDWVVCSSVRAVVALMAARAKPWPRGVRSAAVGSRTAAALTAAGADPAPLVAGESGADRLWPVLQSREKWRDRRVLVPAAPGGRRTLIDGLRSAGALVDEVEAYRMLPRPRDVIAATWNALVPDAVVVASPFAAQTLVRWIGPEALTGLRAVVAIGPTTAAALTAHGIPCSVPARAGFAELARHLSAERSRLSPP